MSLHAPSADPRCVAPLCGPLQQGQQQRHLLQHIWAVINAATLVIIQQGQQQQKSLDLMHRQHRHMHTCTHACTHAHTHTTHAHAHTKKHTRTHAHTRTHTHTHTHTHTPVTSFLLIASPNASIFGLPPTAIIMSQTVINASGVHLFFKHKCSS